MEDVAKVNPKRSRLEIGSQTPVTFIPMAAVGEDCSGILARECREYSEVSKGYTYFQENDVLFAKITPCLQNGKHALATQLNTGFGFGTTEFHVLRAKDGIEPRHLYRVITQPANIEKCTRSFTGTAGQQRVQPETIKSLPILLPPLPEQRAIAEVLDSIDEAIEKTEAVVATTENLRDSLLHRLLTRGVPGWHSEWKEVRGIGTIPTTWDVVRLGEVVQINAANWDPSEGSNILYLDLTSVVYPGILAGPKELRAEDAPSRARRRVNAGDILVSTVRPNLRGFARVVEAPDNLVASTGFAVVRPRSRVNGSFVYHNVMTTRFALYLEKATTGQAYPAVKASDVAAFRLALPPSHEQQAIAQMLDGVDEAIERGSTEKEILQSLKASTAGALLTGRVRTIK